MTTPRPDADRLPGMPAGFRLGYRPWLDGLRGLAILAVFLYHLRLIAGGFLGVDVFFVLSGFLITSLLVEEWQRRGTISFPRFYLRRALRLLPAFFAFLLACFVYVVLFRPSEAAAFGKEALVAACYVSNWPTLHQVPMPTLGHAWSLSLEEQFYFLWPLLLYALLRLNLGRRTTLALVVGGILAAATLRCVLYERYAVPRLGNEAYLMRLYVGLDTRADALLVGCLVALLAAGGLLPRSRRLLFVMGVAMPACAAVLGYLMLTTYLGKPQFYYGLFTAVAVMVAVPVVRLLSAPSRIASALLEFRPLVYLGRISYTLYLVNSPILGWFGVQRLGWTHPVETLAAAGLCLAAAAALSYGVERPFLRWKHLLQPTDSPRPTGDLTATSRAA